MKSILFTAALAALQASASVIVPRDTKFTDTDILVFALNLELIEVNFYTGGLAKFSQQDFTNAGLPSVYRGRVQQILQHEQTHAATIQGLIGKSPVVHPCNYTFPYTDALSFANLAKTIEGVGTSAYIGAAQFISEKDYLIVADSISTIEARHASWLATELTLTPWPGAFDRALTFNEAFTLASNFIVPGSCPSSNPPIAFKANPQLVVQETNVTTGQTIHVSFNITTSQSTPLFAAFLTGVAPVEVFGTFTRTGKGSGTVTVPKGLTGQTYLVLTTTKVQSFTDVGVVAGPAVLDRKSVV